MIDYKVSLSVGGASLYFFTFLIFVFTGNILVSSWMFLFSPLVLITFFYIVIRYGTYNGQELRDDEEWGYENKNKDELGFF